jgi:CO/xanthine dehydrogenase Mo-binding subunit
MTSLIGARQPLTDADAIVTGQALYACDITRPGMLHAKILKSRLPHARIVRIDTSRVRTLPGVAAVLTHEDVPPIPMSGDYPVLSDVVRYPGEEVAAVAATDVETAEDALDLISVEYDPLPHVFDPESARERAAPSINGHGNLGELWDGERACILARGDVEKGLAEADHVFERRFVTQGQLTAVLQPRTCVCEWDERGRLTVWDAVQIPFRIQATLARVLEIPADHVRVVTPFMGGGFGDENEYRYQAIAAFLSRKAGRPVRIEYTRWEESVNCAKKRHPSIIDLRVGVRRDGSLLAMHSVATWHKGAYSCHGLHVPQVAGLTLTMNYTCPNVRYEGYAVLTNLPPFGSFRGYGNTQATFALESMIDIITDALDLDPVEFRLRHASRFQDQQNHVPYTSYGLEECLRRGADRAGWTARRSGQRGAKRLGKYRGRGVAMCRTTGGFGRFDAVVEVATNGHVLVRTGSVDMGTGCRTTLRQVAAAELGAEIGSVSIINGDTAATPFASETTASRTALASGAAVRAAAADAKRQLDALASAPQARPLGGGSLEERLAFLEASGKVEGQPIDAAPGLAGSQAIVVGRATRDLPYIHSFSAQFAEVEVDAETGSVRVLRVISANDVGKAINPAIIEGQIEGGIAQALGFTLFEDLIHDRRTGLPLNANFTDYRLPRSVDMPRIECLIVESDEPSGPFGAKGVGESGLIPLAAAIANAIYDAIGVRFTELPITPARVLSALGERTES